MDIIINLISQRTSVSAKQVIKVLDLAAQGNTIPFIARYRKEVTGSLDEVAIKAILDADQHFKALEQRKEFIINTIAQQQQLTDALRQKIVECFDAQLLEDIYSPYKKKRKTKADTAREAGLEPLAKIIMAQNNPNLTKAASNFLNEKVNTPDLAIQMAGDIVKEWISDAEGIKERFRETYRRYAMIKSTVVKSKKEDAATYRDYFDFEEKLDKSPAHRMLAILRGENESFLRLKIVIDEDRALEYLHKRFVKRGSSYPEVIQDLCSQALKEYIMPAVETQIRKEYKEKADKEAIEVFAKNVSQLLLAAPLGTKPILAIDPGFRTGCKVVCLSSYGDYLEDAVIYPVEPYNKVDEAYNVVISLIKKHEVTAIAIGNGTASREVKDFLERFVIPSADIDLHVVSESGASIYSASDIARQEFPDLDLTVRGAISIGRRLSDPLAELVKVDPKSIGVGQYQHDVNQTALKDALDYTVISAVNKVGIDLNTASQHLCAYVSGLGPILAANIVSHREAIGGFDNKEQLLQVPRLGQKSYEQCAGFFRIRNGKNPLDNTGIHPERYDIAHQMAKDRGVNISDLLGNLTLIADLDPQKYVSSDAGIETIEDILAELKKPGHDPRGEAEGFAFSKSVKTIQDLQLGMRLPGIISNITNFGAFVDVGIKQDGLIHISEISHKRINNPMEVLSLDQKVWVKVIDIDIPRNRISLTLKNS